MTLMLWDCNVAFLSRIVLVERRVATIRLTADESPTYWVVGNYFALHEGGK